MMQSFFVLCYIDVGSREKISSTYTLSGSLKKYCQNILKIVDVVVC